MTRTILFACMLLAASSAHAATIIYPSDLTDGTYTGSIGGWPASFFTVTATDNTLRLQTSLPRPPGILPAFPRG